MVRVCQLCRKNSYLYQNLTFHRIPANTDERKIWFALLNFGEGKILPRRAEICSEHFSKTDFVYRNTGAKCLKKGATPIPVEQENLRLSTSSDSLSSLAEFSFTEHDQNSHSSLGASVSPSSMQLGLLQDGILTDSLPGPSTSYAPYSQTFDRMSEFAAISSSTTLTAPEGSKLSSSFTINVSENELDNIKFERNKDFDLEILPNQTLESSLIMMNKIESVPHSDTFELKSEIEVISTPTASEANTPSSSFIGKSSENEFENSRNSAERNKDVGDEALSNQILEFPVISARKRKRNERNVEDMKSSDLTSPTESQCKPAALEDTNPDWVPSQ